MIFRILDTMTAWQISEMEKDYESLTPGRISVFVFDGGLGPEGLYIEFLREPSPAFMERWRNYLRRVH